MPGPTELMLLLLGLGALGLKVWALVDACIRPGAAFPAAGKLTKVAWIAILVAAVLLGGPSFLGLFGIIGTIAAIVYLVDVRPAVRELRGGSSGGSSSDGPYGPYRR